MLHGATLCNMKRVMVNFSEREGQMIERRAAEEKRSASNFIALLVQRDLTQAGLLKPEKKHAAALAEAEAAGVDVGAVLRRAARSAKK